MTWTDKTFNASTELPALDLTHLHGNESHVREESSFYPIVTAQCVYIEEIQYTDNCTLEIDGSEPSQSALTELNGTVYDIDISAVSPGLHDIVLQAQGVDAFGPFKFYKSVDMDYLTYSINRVQPDFSGDQPYNVANITIIGSREELNP